MAEQEPPSGPTSGSDYAERLVNLQNAWWKRFLNVQAPYRWNVRRQHLGRVLDIGCGIGRNMQHLDDVVGVDHNATSIEVARSLGFTAYTVEGFHASDDARPHSFDSLLVAHVLEHMSKEDDIGLLEAYLPYLKPQGRLFVITPQEAGFRSDATHVQFVDFDVQRSIVEAAGFDVMRQYSFPLPRLVGRVFTYNEFCGVARARA